MLIEAIKAFIYGVLEGVTEWLPVSSTGHIILLEEFLPLEVGEHLGAQFHDEFSSMFEVVIQLGAILAVVVTFFGKLNPFAPSKRQAAPTWASPSDEHRGRAFRNIPGRSDIRPRISRP